MSSIQKVLRDVFHVNFDEVAPWSGLLRAIPVAAMVTVGLANGNPRAAMTLGMGANIIAVLSVAVPARARAGLLVADAAGLGFATFVGSATASNVALHLGLLGLWSFAAGLLVVFGLGPATVGVQSVIAFVVFGRFMYSPRAALELGVLVVAGASVEAIFLLLARVPPSLRVSRTALAAGFRELAGLAGGAPGCTAAGVATSFDLAGERLAKAGLFGRSDVRMDCGLLDVGRRLRAEVVAMRRVRRQLDQKDAPVLGKAVDDGMGLLAAAIADIALRIKERRRNRWARTDETDEIAFDTACPALAIDGDTAALLVHLEAITGEIRAARRLVDPKEGRLSSCVRRTLGRRSGSDGFLRSAIQSELSVLRASVQWESPAFRHATRLAVAVTGAELLGRALSLPRSYWLGYAVAVVLKPDYGSLFRSGLARVAGTILGGTLAALVVGSLHPGVSGTILLAGLTAWAAYSIWPASFAYATGFVTALVLILLSTTQVDTVATAVDRLIDVVLGGGIALAAYVLWPTSSRSDARRALGTLVRAERAYLVTTLAALQGSPEPAIVARTARAARLAWANAESVVGRSLQVPPLQSIDARFPTSVLAAAHRIIAATGSLSDEITRGLSVGPHTELDEISTAFADVLGWIVTRIVAPDAAITRYPAQLRRLYAPIESRLAEWGAPSVVAHQFDEIIDAISTLEAVVTAAKVG